MFSLDFFSPTSQISTGSCELVAKPKNKENSKKAGKIKSKIKIKRALKVVNKEDGYDFHPERKEELERIISSIGGK